MEKKIFPGEVEHNFFLLSPFQNYFSYRIHTLLFDCPSLSPQVIYCIICLVSTLYRLVRSRTDGNGDDDAYSIKNCAWRRKLSITIANLPPPPPSSPYLPGTNRKQSLSRTPPETEVSAHPSPRLSIHRPDSKSFYITIRRHHLEICV